jgi:hypothetical protein
MNRGGNAISQLDYRRDFPQFPTRLPPQFPAIPNAITAAVSRNSHGDYRRGVREGGTVRSLLNR